VTAKDHDLILVWATLSNCPAGSFLAERMNTLERYLGSLSERDQREFAGAVQRAMSCLPDEAIERSLRALGVGVSDDLLTFGRCAAVLSGEHVYRAVADSSGIDLDLSSGDALLTMIMRFAVEPSPDVLQAGSEVRRLTVSLADSERSFNWAWDALFQIAARAAESQWAPVLDLSDVDHCVLSLDYRHGVSAPWPLRIERLGGRESLVRAVRPVNRVSPLRSSGFCRRELEAVLRELKDIRRP